MLVDNVGRNYTEQKQKKKRTEQTKKEGEELQSRLEKSKKRQKLREKTKKEGEENIATTAEVVVDRIPACASSYHRKLTPP